MNRGDRLRNLRKQAKLGQGALAQQLGIDTSLISRFENGEREPSSQQILALARAFGVSIDYLLNADAQPRFILRGSKAGDGDESDEIHKVIVDAEQQVHYLHTAYNMADAVPRRFALRYDREAISMPDLSDFVDELRTTLQLNQFVSLDELKEALHDRHIHVFEWQMPLNLSGLSYRGGFTVILINRAHGVERRLFTLAHELAHVLFHFEKDKDESGIVSLFSRRSDPDEKEANQFAAELLMPNRLVYELSQQWGERLRDKESLESFAQLFNVSRDAMFYRLASHGFFKWSEKSQYFTDKPSIQPQSIKHRVDKIKEQVSPEFLQLALRLLDQEQISAGKLAEWFFANRPNVEAMLAERHYEADAFIV